MGTNATAKMINMTAGVTTRLISRDKRNHARLTGAKSRAAKKLIKESAAAAISAATLAYKFARKTYAMNSATASKHEARRALRGRLNFAAK